MTELYPATLEDDRGLGVITPPRPELVMFNVVPPAMVVPTTDVGTIVPGWLVAIGSQLVANLVC